MPGIIERPPPYLRLCRRRPASNVLFRRCRLDPVFFETKVTLSRTLLVDFCNQNSPRAQPLGSTNPRSALADTARPACAEPTGLRPHPPHRPLNPGDACASTLARPLRIIRRLPLGTSRGFTSQGPGAFTHRRLSFFVSRARLWPFGRQLARHRMRASPEGNTRSRELRPNPIRSDTSRHDTAAPSAGDCWQRRCRHTNLCSREKA